MKIWRLGFDDQEFEEAERGRIPAWCDFLFTDFVFSFFEVHEKQLKEQLVQKNNNLRSFMWKTLCLCVHGIYYSLYYNDLLFIYLVCGNTMCVSTCQVEFVLRELPCFILLPRSRFIGCLGDFSVLKRTVLLFNYYLGGRYRKLASTTTLAYRIVINCTTVESVLELVPLFQLARSNHRQETYCLLFNPDCLVDERFVASQKDRFSIQLFSPLSWDAIPNTRWDYYSLNLSEVNLLVLSDMERSVVTPCNDNL